MKKLTPFLYYTLAAFAAVAPFYAALPQASAQQQASLHHRLGGYDALAAVIDDFVGRLATDPQRKHFFVGHNKKVSREFASMWSTSCATPPVAPARTPDGT
jgi:hypothetical protein